MKADDLDFIVSNKVVGHVSYKVLGHILHSLVSYKVVRHVSYKIVGHMPYEDDLTLCYTSVSQSCRHVSYKVW